MLEILDRICEGKGNLEDLDKLESLAYTIKDASLCGLGQTAPNPVLSTLKYFRNEYLAHVEDKTCPSGVCKELLAITITDKCIGCTMCKTVCPVDCISGEKKGLHVIDQDACIKCEACITKCPVKCIVKK
jgi:NADH-quinone oxidoreductase subunit F/NADP-reducing hydrogenase subunit HndC